MPKTKVAIAALALLLIAGCAHQTYQPVTPGSGEPSASVADTIHWVGTKRAQTFIVQAVDGTASPTRWTPARRRAAIMARR